MASKGTTRCVDVGRVETGLGGVTIATSSDHGADVTLDTGSIALRFAWS